MKEKNHKNLKTKFDLQSQEIFVEKNNFKNSLHILEEYAGYVQVYILNTYFFKICSKRIKLN